MTTEAITQASALPLRQRAAAVAAQYEENCRKADEQRAAQVRERRRSRIVAELNGYFGIEPDSITPVENDTDTEQSDIAVAEGLLFQYRRDRWGDFGLHVGRTCADCKGTVWLHIAQGRYHKEVALRGLHEKLSIADAEVTHEKVDRFHCLQQWKDGEPVTDTRGNPLSPFSEKTVPPQIETIEDRLAKCVRELVRDELRELGGGQ